MSLIVGIDASRAVKTARTGPENYSFEIIRRLVAADPTVQFRLYAPYLPREEFPRGSNIHWRILPQRRLWSQVALAREIRHNPPEVLFVPSHVVPLFSQVRTVVTIHDLAYQYFPASYSRFDRQYLAFSTGVSVSKATAVIVPSESTKRDLLKEYPNLPADKISVIYHAYNQDIFRPDIRDDRPPIDPPYICYVGRIEEKKNLRLLVEAFALFAKEKRNVKLVLSGKAGYGYEQVQEAINAKPESIRSRIIQPGYLPQYDMVRYLRHASVFAFPSWYEGFGLSVLEAMAVGTPVICSDSSSLPEVVENAAIKLPPTSPLSWAAAISRIINQPHIAQQMREKSISQAKKFSWEKATAETLSVLLQAAKK